VNIARLSPQRLTALVIVAIYALWIEVIAMRAGDPGELWWWLLEIPFFLWIVAPIITAYLVGRDNWLFTIGLAAIAAYSLDIYERDMFGPGARSTSALIFIWLPIYQWVAVLILLAMIWSIRRWAK